MSGKLFHMISALEDNSFFFQIHIWRKTRQINNMTTWNVVKALCGSYKSVRIKIVQNKMLN